MTESLADRMKHWRSGDPLARTTLAWIDYIAQQINIDNETARAKAKAKAAKYAPRMVVVPLAGDKP